ncbi:MAG: glycosyltransferase family 2 protein [Nanoarchaeota archaeon]
MAFTYLGLRLAVLGTSEKIFKAVFHVIIMNVSIVLPIYKANKEILQRVLTAVKKQKFSGGVEVLPIDKGWGMAKQMNYGINKSKYEIVVTLPQDCIPEGEHWLENLVGPLKDSAIVASASKVHFPVQLWGRFGIFTRAMTLNEKGTITPLLDEKGDAYRKSTLKEVGLFNETHFRTAGEDFDMYMKIKEKGKIAYPNAVVLHVHPTTFKQRLRKTYQYANGFGALLRMYGFRIPRGYVGLLKALPIAGILLQFVSYPWRKGLALLPAYLVTSVISHPYFLHGFWKGFFSGKQTV